MHACQLWILTWGCENTHRNSYQCIEGKYWSVWSVFECCLLPCLNALSPTTPSSLSPIKLIILRDQMSYSLKSALVFLPQSIKILLYWQLEVSSCWFLHLASKSDTCISVPCNTAICSSVGWRWIIILKCGSSKLRMLGRQFYYCLAGIGHCSFTVVVYGEW